jgi:hypothetical protein
MSTSVDLDDRLFVDLQRAARGKGIPVRAFIEQALRDLLPAPTNGPFVQRVHDFGAHLESPWTVLSEIESDAYTSSDAK